MQTKQQQPFLITTGLLLWGIGGCGGETTTSASAPDGGTTDSANVEIAADASFASTFAIRRVYLGEVDRSDSPDASAWQAYGRDIDGLNTTTSSTNVCSLAAGAPLTAQVDGLAGNDNAWGATILPILMAAMALPSASTTATEAVGQGTSTLLIEVNGLADDSGQSATGLVVRAAAGATCLSPPTFDSSMDWPTLTGVTPTDFTNATITSGTLTTKAGSSPLVFVLPLFGRHSLKLTIHEPVISFAHPAHADLTGGTISGVLDPAEFTGAFNELGTELSASLCGSGLDGIDALLAQSADILLDGSNTSGTPCTGISIGLGFDATLVSSTTTGALLTPPKECP